MGAHLFQGLQRQVTLLVVRLNELQDRREESGGVPNGDVAGSEGSGAANVFRRRAEEVDRLRKGLGLRSKVAARSGALDRVTLARKKELDLHDSSDLSERKETEDKSSGRSLGALRRVGG